MGQHSSINPLPLATNVQAKVHQYESHTYTHTCKHTHTGSMCANAAIYGICPLLVVAGMEETGNFLEMR